MKKLNKEILCGADVVSRDGFDFYGKCGLITNHTGVLKNLTSTVDLLKHICDLRVLFAPEHGVRGDQQAGIDISSYIDNKTGLPVYSLFCEDTKQAEEIMSSLDTVIFDIQDVGARFYTYQYTMTDTMKFCAERRIRFIVLDRPNPLGGLTAEGTVLDRRFSSFVGRFPTPTRSALTIGEFALMMNDTEGIGCDLTVIPMENWKRDMYFDDTDLIFIQPSPNIPTLDTAFYYVGTCIFEDTNLSEGRGTTKPFEIIGAPWLKSEEIIKNVGKLSGVILRECSFTPTFSKYKDTFCHGIQIHITDRKSFSPFEAGMKIFDAARKTHEEFQIESNIAYLLGTDEIFNKDFNIDSFIEKSIKSIAEWQELSKNWYLY